MNDLQLLERHRNGCEQSFAELVRRHIGWVFGVARRRLRDEHVAQDVAQAVFVLLHRKLPKFPSDRAMMSWLHRTARYATDVAIRSERRRRHHETEAGMLHPQSTSEEPSSEWNELAPMLDQLIGKLARADREAVLLRFFRGMSFADVGQELGTSEEAARKRVERAIARLRDLAARKCGLTTLSTIALSASIVQHVMPFPPSGLIATTTGAAAAPAGSSLVASSAPIAKGTLIMMTTAKLKAAAAVAFVGIFVVGGTMAVVRPASAPATQGSSNRDEERYARVGKDDLYPKLAPYAGVRWKESTPEVQLDDKWYELIAIDNQSAGSIVDYCKEHYKDIWQKRFEEDLVEVMGQMGHEPGESVKLELRDVDSNEKLTKENVAMTHENRQAIWHAAQAREEARKSSSATKRR